MIPPPYPFPGKWPSLFQQQQQQSRGQAAQWLTPYTQIHHGHAVAPRAAGMSPVWPTLAPYPQPAPFVPMATYHHQYANDSRNELIQHQEEDAGAEEDEDASEENDDDYEYGYVLNDDWRQYLKDNVLSEDESWEDASHAPERQRQHQRQKKTAPTNQATRPRGGKKHQPTVTPRPLSQLELALDGARELERQRRQQRLLTATEDTSSREEALPKSHMTISSMATGSDSDRTSGDPSGEHDRHSSLQVVEHLEAALHLRFEAFCDNNTPAVWPQGAS